MRKYYYIPGNWPIYKLVLKGEPYLEWLYTTGYNRTTIETRNTKSRGSKPFDLNYFLKTETHLFANADGVLSYYKPIIKAALIELAEENE